jgi:hypothetical protein
MTAESFKPITGTFLDALPADIPSQNWSRAEWARQFDVFQEMGMDTVIIIRVGWRYMSMYDSRVMGGAIVEDEDMVAFFLEESARVGVRLYMGLHDTEDHWANHDNDGEAAVNLDLIDELLERYGRHSAFFGWYLSHEPPLSYSPWEVWNPLIQKMRRLTPQKPILLSPRYEGRKWTPDRVCEPKTYARAFDDMLGKVSGRIDAAAFMDGHVEFHELDGYMAAMKPVLDKHDIAYWSNVETFDRDMPFRFPPIAWPKLKKKIEVAQAYTCKLITFESPHFLSPYSMWDSARRLFERYMEYIQNRLRL